MFYAQLVEEDIFMLRSIVLSYGKVGISVSFRTNVLRTS